MPTYRVRALHADGVRQHQVDAPDRQSIAAALGLAPQHVLQADEVTALARGTRFRSPASRRFPVRLFAQELSVLLGAGIPLLEALETLQEKEASSRARATMTPLIHAVRQGHPLSHAMGLDEEAFDPLLRAVIAANERSGQLDTALAQHARYLGWMEDLRSRLIAACIYPALLLLVGSAVVLFLLLFVLPRFAGVLEGIHGDLPWASLALITIGQTAGRHPGLVGGGALVALGLLVSVARSPAARSRVLAGMWQLPVLGERLKVIALARFYRSLSMLLGAGVPTLSALRIVEGVMAGPWQPHVRAAAADVEQGTRLSQALESNELATPVARRMVRVGERSGEVAAMLEKAAAFHDEEVARLSEVITRAVNPILMLVMGVVIGGIIVLMYLPIFQLVEQVQ